MHLPAAVQTTAEKVGLEIMLEGAQSHIWCSEFSWQTVRGPLTAKLR